MSPDAVTLAENTIHNPAEKRHFMTVDPVVGSVRILFGNTVIAWSQNALRLKEVGHQMYDPVLYLPRSDVVAELEQTEKATHCPLKGDCSWFSLVSQGGDNIAWSYQAPFEFANLIKGRFAFDARRVTIEEHPA